MINHQKQKKRKTKKKIKYFRYDCDYFGNITNERGVEHLEDDRLDRGIISFETIDTFENIKKHIIGTSVDEDLFTPFKSLHVKISAPFL